MMQKSTKIALISGSIIAISLGGFFWYIKRKTQQEQQSGNVLTDLQKIYNQLLSGTRPTSQGGTKQGGTQRSGQDESQRQAYKEPTQSSQSSQTTQTANQKQLEQQKKQEEQFFKPKDSQQQPQPQNTMQYNDAQYNLAAYSSGESGYTGSGYNTGGYSAGGYGSSWGSYGNSWLNGERGYGGNISDY